ncbi:helix-turn-helix transcriptional regulator [Marinilactibacillus kalidii]|uniref:helix-turn-helix transcriptional regulator n=1 Tax=Marinilactibacillus kalidii TaxID=2820274 RepID=UPI001ABE532C|nr:helix-turn-helix transcriptional regulator [Marinilactibacillus kalidii]
MSKNSEAIKKRLHEDSAFKEAFEEEELKLDLADIMFALRQETGLNQSQFAKRVNKSCSTITRIEEASMSPSIILIEEIAHALNKRLELKIVDRENNRQEELV